MNEEELEEKSMIGWGIRHLYLDYLRHLDKQAEEGWISSEIQLPTFHGFMMYLSFDDEDYDWKKSEEESSPND